MPAFSRIGGRYTLRERIGAGGMGEVWLAREEGPDGFQKTVVIKRLLPEAARYLDYFKAEARLVAQLPHQNIVQVLNFFIDEDGQHNIVMEYVEGTDLEELIYTDRGRLTVEMAVYIAAEALKGLDFAHSARIDRAHGELVHRDISPHNLLVSYGAEVKVTDFGIAKAAVEYREKTVGNKFRGKIAYAAPEALDEREDQPLDRRADLYAMGIVLREMLTKQRTFTGSMWQTLVAVKEGTVPPLAEVAPNVPAPLVAIIERLMHVDRARRFDTAAEARAALVRAVPEWATADGALRDYVRSVTRRRPRLTSPFPEGDGSPMLVREEGSPVSIPTVVRASPDAPTRAESPHADSSRPTEILPGNANTLPASIHDDPTHVRGNTALLHGYDRDQTADPRTAPPKSTLGDWGRFLLAIGIAFSVSAVVIFVVKLQRRAAVTAAVPVAVPVALAVPDTVPVAVPVAAPPPPKKPASHHHRDPASDDLGVIVMDHGNADLTVDGVYMGHTPVHHLIAPGAHRVTLFDTATFKRATVEITVSAGHATRVDFP